MLTVTEQTTNRRQIVNEPSFPSSPWENGRKVFKCGPKKPKSEFSVKGQIYKIVEQYPEGITGNELVRICRQKVRTPRSYHAQNKPQVEWVRGYVTGMARERFQFLTIIDPN